MTHGGPTLTDRQLRASAVAVSAASLPLPTGAATSALQTQPGVDIGDVTINNANGASAVNVQDGGNVLTVDGSGSAGTAASGVVTIQGIASMTPVSVSVGAVDASTLRDFHLEVGRSVVTGYTALHKYGANGAVSTSLVPITALGVYQMPTTAQALEFVSSNANDTAAGSGAREVTVIGLNSSWAEVTQTVTTNGTVAVALSTNLIRLYRWYVSSSGTYATTSTGSHVGTLTIRAAGGGATWDSLSITPYPTGQSQIACYTIPTGKTGYLLSTASFVDSTRAIDVYLFIRAGADDVASPYSGAMRVQKNWQGLTGQVSETEVIPRGPFVGPCDVVFMGVTSAGTGTISVEFDMVLVNT